MHVATTSPACRNCRWASRRVRDPGNDDSLTLDRRARAEKGELLMPNVYPSSLIDGKGPYTAQVANVADQPGRGDRARRQGEGQGFHRREVLRHAEQGLATGRRGGGAQAGPARAWAHPGGHASARCDQGGLRRSHAHQLDHDAGHARRCDRREQRHHAFRGPGPLREGCRSQRQAHQRHREHDGDEGYLQ